MNEASDHDSATGYTDEDREAELLADFEVMSKIIEADDKLAAAIGELREARRLHAVTQALYDAVGRDVAMYKGEAARWMRKAKKAAACQDCMTALERE